LCIHVHIHVQFYIPPHIHFRVLYAVVTFIKMVSMVRFYIVRRLFPLFSFCDRGVIVSVLQWLYPSFAFWHIFSIRSFPGGNAIEPGLV
jgi:hypothetical protein